MWCTCMSIYMYLLCSGEGELLVEYDLVLVEFVVVHGQQERVLGLEVAVN